MHRPNENSKESAYGILGEMAIRSATGPHIRRDGKTENLPDEKSMESRMAQKKLNPRPSCKVASKSQMRDKPLGTATVNPYLFEKVHFSLILELRRTIELGSI